MSQDTSRESKNPKPKIFGAAIGEKDVLRLIGGIVEKGFSEVPKTRPLAPPSAPRPTLLPFPVARHRSHGPHWAPRAGNLKHHIDEDDEDDLFGKEEDFEGMEVASDVDPIQKKEKKCLDFSGSWKIVKKDGGLADHAKEKGRCLNGTEVGRNEKGASNGLKRQIGDSGDVKLQSVTTGNNVPTIKEARAEANGTLPLASAKELHSFRNDRNANSVATEVSTCKNGLSEDVDRKIESMQKPYTASSDFSAKTLGGEENSLQSEIDAENRARLASMSADELAEAQAEIMAKLNPKLIGALRKRGQDKGKRQKSSLTGVTGSASDGVRPEEALAKGSGNALSHKPKEMVTEDAQKNKEDKVNSLQSDIDAENRARLASMSADELAEAQAEIMSKLNPKLVGALRKRGQDKGKRQKSSSRDVTGSASDGVRPEEALAKGSGNALSHEPKEMVTEDAQKNKEGKVSTNISRDKGSIWDAWSKKVEHVRDVRFSLDGNIMDFGLESDIGPYSSDNVCQRDYLRTEGDPGAAGYTIKEAIALSRSVVPGQRTLALSVIAAILKRAISNIIQNQGDSFSNISDAMESADWMAIWAYALGPEPDLALSLRISLDDNHNNVVLTCAKAILSAVSYDMNNIFFDMSEKTPTYSGDVCTAPIFRSKPDINDSFLRGGFWKYNSKPSNILFGADDKAEGEHTIQDDVVVAGQDFAAGLVRMGTLERICYLLEMGPAAPLEACLISILIALARHSPTCAAAVLNCGRLIETIAGKFASNEQVEINSSKIKSVTLFKVLAWQSRKNCSKFITNGVFRQLTWHLYRNPFSLNQWVKSGIESCILSSALLVEQLRLWKVSVNYGYSISDFSDLFSSLCALLSVPTFEKLISNNVMNEYCAIAKEAYLLLDVMAGRLPKFYSHMQERTADSNQDTETWSWRHFGPIIDLALEWIQVKKVPYLSRLFNSQCNDGERLGLQDSGVNSLLWVISSVLSMLASLLKSVIPEDFTSFPNGRLPWLPDFVPKIGLEFIKNGYFKPDAHPSENGSLVEYLCDLRLKGIPELAISSQCCLQGFIQVASYVDKLVQHANLVTDTAQIGYDSFSSNDKIIASGILKSCKVEIQYLLSTLTKAISGDWQFMQHIEMFSRGGPAPGVGVGWGASGGGYWSLNTLLAQQDARLLIYLLETPTVPSTVNASEAEEMDCTMQKLNSALTACLTVGPGNSAVLDKLLNVIFQVPVLKHLRYGIQKFLSLRKGYSSFKWKYDDHEYLLFANVLASHFKTRWLGTKKRKAASEINHFSHKPVKKEVRSLETIHEDMDATNKAGEESSSLILEWAHQRLPLPAHWFLSAISTLQFDKKAMEVPLNILEVSKSGLFFLLGIEAIPTFLTSKICSPFECVPVVWKLHAMSATLLSGMGVLEDEKSRDVYETLQNIYGEVVDDKKNSHVLGNADLEHLKFASDIHANYSTFIENLVEQFAAESYGDVVFGRQVTMYLNRSVEASVRLSAWNALSSARVLELLPPLHNCLAMADGYLEPIEDKEAILEAYTKSWTTGALDKAANRSSVAFSLVLHHLSSFIFGNVTDDSLKLRNKLAKSLMRDYSRKQQHEGMMMKLICYQKPDLNSRAASEMAASSVPVSEVEKRLQLLREICDGCAAQIEKLESCIRKESSKRGGDH